MASTEATELADSPTIGTGDGPLRRENDGHSGSRTLNRAARVRAEMIADMIRDTGKISVFPYAVIAVLVGVFFDKAMIWQIVALFVAVTALQYVSQLFRRSFERANVSTDQAEAWGLRHAFLSVFSGLVWGIGLAAFFDSQSVPHQAFLALFVFGALFAGVISRALYPLSFVAYAVPLVLPICILLLSEWRVLPAAIALTGIGALGVTVGWVMTLNDRYRQSMNWRFENSDLIERLESAHRTAEVARARAEAGDRAKSEFLATITHELRTPMNGVIGMTGLLLDTQLTTQQRSYGEIVRESADALLTLINDILDLTKLEAGHVDLDESSFELAQVVDGTVALMAVRAQAKGIGLGLYIAPDVPDVMVADAGRLRQIILNLLANAVKFTEQGHVQVNVTRPPSAPHTVRFEFVDTGIGIPSNVLPRLFRPFNQGDVTISRRFGGTGLGLAISRRLASAMGGEIRVSSEPGHGSVFTVDLPIRDGRRVWQPKQIKQPVVIMSNRGFDHDLLARYMTDWGMSPVQAEDPDTAINTLSGLTGRRSIVIDSRMLMNDRDFFDRLKSARIAQLNVIMLDVVGAGSERPEDDGAGLARHHVQLPVRRQALYDALTGDAGQHVAISATPSDAPHRRRGRVVAPEDRLRVLVVDDVAINQKLACSIVENAGHEAMSAGSGREALQALQAMPYDLVLMDVEMPDMDGMATTKALRDLPGHAGAIPVIAMSAHPEASFIQPCLDAGMDEYLTKPLDADRLVGLLDHFSEKQRQSDRETSDPVEKLITSLGEEGALGIIRSFHSELQARAKNVDVLQRAGNFGQLRREAQALCGAAQGLGFDDLATASRDMTDNADASTGRVSDEKVAEFQAVAGAVLNRLQFWLSKLAEQG